MVIPLMSASARASFTSSSLNGFTMASIFFISGFRFFGLLMCEPGLVRHVHNLIAATVPDRGAVLSEGQIARQHGLYGALLIFEHRLLVEEPGEKINNLN